MISGSVLNDDIEPLYECTVRIHHNSFNGKEWVSNTETIELSLGCLNLLYNRLAGFQTLETQHEYPMDSYPSVEFGTIRKVIILARKKNMTRHV